MLSLCLINQAPWYEDVWETAGIAPHFLTSVYIEVSGQSVGRSVKLLLALASIGDEYPSAACNTSRITSSFLANQPSFPLPVSQILRFLLRR
jgi:hypothetical protein